MRESESRKNLSVQRGCREAECVGGESDFHHEKRELGLPFRF